MTSGLLVLGHGSRRNRHSREAVCRQAERIRATGRFDEVGVGFWKEEPTLQHGLDAMGADYIRVVPMFAADGYYTREVIPRELQLDGPETKRGGRTIQYCTPVGAHPAMAEIIVDRACGAAAGDREGLVILGHGTPRQATSAGTAFEQAERVRDRGLFEEVCVLFIDQQPNMAEVWDLTTSDCLVMVPLFMAEGWHVRETVPQDLCLEAGLATRGDRTLRITEAVGTHPRVAELIVDLATG